MRRLPPVALLVLGRLARAMSQCEHDRSSLVRALRALAAALQVEGLTFEIHVGDLLWAGIGTAALRASDERFANAAPSHASAAKLALRLARPLRQDGFLYEIPMREPWRPSRIPMRLATSMRQALGASAVSQPLVFDRLFDVPGHRTSQGATHVGRHPARAWLRLLCPIDRLCLRVRPSLGDRDAYRIHPRRRRHRRPPCLPHLGPFAARAILASFREAPVP